MGARGDGRRQLLSLVLGLVSGLVSGLVLMEVGDGAAVPPEVGDGLGFRLSLAMDWGAAALQADARN